MSNSMQTIFTILFVWLLLSSGVLLVANFISRVIRKNGRKLNIATIVSLGGLLLSFLVMLNDFSMLLMMIGLLLVLAILLCLPVMLVRKMLHHSNKMLAQATLVMLMLGVSAFIASSRIADRQRQQAYEAHEINEEEEGPTQTSLDFEVKDGDAAAEIVYYNEAFHGVNVYDADYFDLNPFVTDATYADCREVLAANEGISSDFKPMLEDYLVRLESHYPDLPLQVLHHNLKTLTVQELSGMDFIIKSMSADSLGCYRQDENAIYIPEGTVYKEGEFGFQALIHEFSHATRDMIGKGDEDGYGAHFMELGSDCLLNEAMNSVFSCTLLNYYEWDIAYQIPSNYLRIMLECMDNYEVEDYFRHSESWFYDKLDEATGYTNYGRVIWKLISLQRNDWKSEKIEIPPEEYYPIYDYLCDLYFAKYITDDMTEEERNAVADGLVEKAFYDAPEGYIYTPERIYENLSSWGQSESE